MCVWTIWIDVKLLFVSSVHYLFDLTLHEFAFFNFHAGGQSHVCSWLPNEEGCIHDWYDSGTLESRTCQFFRNGKRLNPRTSLSNSFFQFASNQTKWFSFTSVPVRFSQSELLPTSSDGTVASSKDVERILLLFLTPGHLLFPVRFNWSVFARTMHSTSVIR